ncbi:Uncharacterised protein [Salmonella enterica subsp. houtenae]|nr:Uncharacterised protein [Salmonella enterica subsp. houtenae]VUD23278.1 Uncharacterised protein [Salmonella sp. NCTC 7297]
MFLCIGKAHEMYKSYERGDCGTIGRRNTPGFGLAVIKYRGGIRETGNRGEV